jgi:hypothetical protein
MTEKKPRYDGLYVFRPNLAELQPGDIFLTKNSESSSFKGRSQSEIIAAATGGNFSHALLCTRPPTLIEAIGDGVSNISAQICFVHDLKHVRVLRYRNQKIADEAGRIALMALGKAYSVRAAIRSIAPEVDSTEYPDDGTFCSALVAAAFRSAGAPEFAAINPMKVTPANLETSKHFSDITSKIFEKILSPNNIESMSALDGDRIISPLAGQAATFLSYYAELSPMISKFIEESDIPDTVKIPTTFLECLRFIVLMLMACEMKPSVFEGTTAHRGIKAIDDMAFNLLSEGKIHEMQRAATLIDEKESQQMIAQSYELHPDIDLADTKGLIVATRAQIASRSSSLGDLEDRGYSRAWDEWLKVAQEVVDVQRRRLLVLEEVLARVFPGEKVPGE